MRWTGLLILSLLVGLLILLRTQSKPTRIPTDTPLARLPELDNPFAPPRGGVSMGNDPAGMATTASWSGQRRVMNPRVIQRPEGSDAVYSRLDPRYGRGSEPLSSLPIDMPAIRWAQARYDAYQAGRGDQASYSKALGILRLAQAGGWFVVPASLSGPQRFERYQPPYGQVLPVTEFSSRPPGGIWTRPPATAATLLASEI